MIMEYYLIKQCVVNPIKPLFVQPEPYKYKLSKEEFEKIPDVSLGYYEYSQETELPAIMYHPTFMVNQKIKKVIEMYDEAVCFKALTILPNDFDKVNEASITYGIPYLRKYDCIHEDSIIMPEGTIKKLVIDHKKIPNADIFQIKNIVQNKILVSLRMAESISRRNVYGVEFERVEMR